MAGRLPPVLPLLLATLLASPAGAAQGHDPLRAQLEELQLDLERHPVQLEPLPVSPATALAETDPSARMASLLPLLEGLDPARMRELERRYQESGNAERRLLERTFGVIEHRFRVDADPLEIYRRWQEAGVPTRELAAALEEIVTGRYAAYYFFDAVIRPNVFAPPDPRRSDSALHEKVHLIQPSIYRALGLRCSWRDPRDGCARSLEAVAVYLTEFAVLKRSAPTEPDVSLNRRITQRLAAEAARCGYGEPLPRCPDPERAEDYVVLPLQLAGDVSRFGLEEGIRRFVRGLGGIGLAVGCVEPCRP